MSNKKKRSDRPPKGDGGYKKCPPGYKKIFPRYIRRNGKKIYPTNSEVFCFCVPE